MTDKKTFTHWSDVPKELMTKTNAKKVHGIVIDDRFMPVAVIDPPGGYGPFNLYDVSKIIGNPLPLQEKIKFGIYKAYEFLPGEIFRKLKGNKNISFQVDKFSKGKLIGYQLSAVKNGVNIYDGKPVLIPSGYELMYLRTQEKTKQNG